VGIRKQGRRKDHWAQAEQEARQALERAARRIESSGRHHSGHSANSVTLKLQAGKEELDLTAWAQQYVRAILEAERVELASKQAA
jgi:hypothetical protein